MANDQSIETLKGIGEKTAKLFEKVGIRTIDDLLQYYPRDMIPMGNRRLLGNSPRARQGQWKVF